MHLFLFFSAAVGATAAKESHVSSQCAPFPPSMITFSANFQQPQPPLVKPYIQASFVQHKWNQNLSHIMTGHIANSPTSKYVRVAEAYDDQMASSLFNYLNVTKEGLVDNTLTVFDAGSTVPEVWRGYVNSNYPLFSANILVDAGAVYSGLTRRNFVDGPVAMWSIMYQGVIPVTVYVDGCNAVVGYDYFATSLRTRVITELFNIKL